MKPLLTDIVGNWYGELEVLSAIKRDEHGNTIYLCKCKCGNVKEILRHNLTQEGTIACGDNKHKEKYEDRRIPAAHNVFTHYNDGDLVFDEFFELAQNNCVYCGREPANTRKNRSSIFKYNGLDRVDSNQLHNKNNVVPCCKFCNQIKSDLSLDEFAKLVSDIYHHWAKYD